MKKITILVLFVLGIFSQEEIQAQSTNKSVEVLKQEVSLINIQANIDKAFMMSFKAKNVEALDTLEKSLGNTKLEQYWKAYINYKKVISAMNFKDKKLGKKSVEKGQDILEKLKDKNAEDYALLCLLKSLSFTYASPMKAPFISMKISKLFEKGFSIDDTNFRLHFVQGQYDMHKPTQFGGGKIAEKHLKLAVTLPENNLENSKLPTWGKEDSYSAIIKYYLKNNQKEEAKKYYESAIKLYPNKYVITSLSNRFSD